MERGDLIGAILDGRYRVIEPVAEGAMGVVYRAERVKLGRIVAIKVLHDVLPNELSARKRFEIEAMAMAKLEHPHCASVLDVGVHGERPYVVMDFVSGQNLKDVVASGPQPIPRATEIVRQVLSGLAHAHEHGIIHRDIKPANIVLSQKTGLGDHVKILDFGLARLHDTGQNLTTGIVVGTPAYMAPEQIRGTLLDHRVDLYACGVLLFELLTGQKPFHSEKDDPIEVCKMHLSDPIPRLDARLPGVDFGELEGVVAKALAKRSDDRYASAEEYAAAIDAASPRRPSLGTMPPSPPGGGPSGAPSGAPSRASSGPIDLMGPTGPTGPTGPDPHPAGNAVGVPTPPDPASSIQLASADVMPVGDVSYPPAVEVRSADVMSAIPADPPPVPARAARAGLATPPAGIARGGMATPAAGTARSAPEGATPAAGIARGGMATPAAGTARRAPEGATPAAGVARGGMATPAAGVARGGMATPAAGVARGGMATPAAGVARGEMATPAAGVARGGMATPAAGVARGGMATPAAGVARGGSEPAPEPSVEPLSRPGTFLGLPVTGPHASGPRELPPPAGEPREPRLPAGEPGVAPPVAGVAGRAPRRRTIALVAGALVAVVVVLAIAANRGGTASPGGAGSSDGAGVASAATGQPDAAREIVARANELVTQGEREAALELLNRSRKQYPDSAALPYAAGRIYFSKYYWTDGLKSFRDALRNDPAYRTDPELIKTVLRGFITTPGYNDELASFLRDDIGGAAQPFLEETARDHPNPAVRSRAASELRRYR